MGGILHGTSNSSTRAEIVGALAQMVRPGAVHIQTDSKAMMDRGLQLLWDARQSLPGSSLIRMKNHRRRDVRLTPDGDLWHAFLQGVHAKGQHAIKISWVPSHTTLLDLFHRPELTTQQVINNGIADTIADHAASLCGYNGLRLACKFFAARQSAQIKLAIQIQDLIVKVLQQEAGERKLKADAAAKEAQPFGGKAVIHIKPPVSYIAGTWEDGIGITIFEPSYAGLGDDDACILRQLFCFWRATRWIPASSASNITSWVEIFIFFQIKGGRVVKGNSHLGARLTPMRKQLTKFMHDSKHLIRTFSSDDTVNMLRSSGARCHKLASYGIEEQLACIQGQLCMSEELCAQMHACLCTIRGAK